MQSENPDLILQTRPSQGKQTQFRISRLRAGNSTHKSKEYKSTIKNYKPILINPRNTLEDLVIVRNPRADQNTLTDFGNPRLSSYIARQYIRLRTHIQLRLFQIQLRGTQNQLKETKNHIRESRLMPMPILRDSKPFCGSQNNFILLEPLQDIRNILYRL